MKVAYILSPSCLTSNVYSGVVVQANQWAAGLERLGHEVIFPQAHKPIHWSDFDVIHLFQHGPWAADLATALRSRTKKLVFSPIIDPPVPYGLAAGWLARIPFEKARLSQRQRLLRKLGDVCDSVLARSEHEAISLRAVGVPPSKVPLAKIPVSKNWTFDDTAVQTASRNGAIFHVSHLNQPRKNVRMLIEIAIAHNLPLRLAGSVSNEKFRDWLGDIQKNHSNIVYLGRISDEDMLDEMLTCSVFCLPSLYEGVGLVALDAALCGANLVVTNRGGTPEYFGETTRVVDPRDEKALSRALIQALSNSEPDMDARQFVLDHFSLEASARNLVDIYAS